MEVIGRNGKNALAQMMEKIFPKLELAVILIYFSILVKVFRPSRTPCSNTFKPFSVSVLQCRIAAVLERYGKSRKRDIWTDGYITIDFEQLYIIKGEEKIVVTSFEYKLLKLFISNKNTVLTRRMFLEKLWDNEKENYVDEHALTVSINRLRGKLETSKHKYIKTIYGMGYTWVGEEISEE